LLEGGTEPLAADLRKEGDGRRLGLLKLVAGLAGVGLDALVQRDATRRIRQVTFVGSTAVAAMLVMALLMALALAARAEAQRERADAEGLVEFMLTDLRDKLRAVGRVDIMEAVNRRALARYGGGGALDSLSGEALSRRARLLHATAEDQITLGNASSARLAAEEAYRTTNEQLSRDPSNLQRQLEHARSIFWIGRAHEVQKEWPQAQRQYALFAAATDRLLAAAPRNADYMKEVGWSRIDLGNVQLNGIGDFSRAQRYYEEAIGWFGRAMAIRPDDDTARVLANAYGWLADSFFNQKFFPASLEARRRQFQITRALHEKHLEDMDETYRLAIARRAVARSLAKVGQGDRAREELLEAIKVSAWLSDRDPRNGDWMLLRGMIGCDLLYIKAAALPETSRGHYRAEVSAVASALRQTGNARLAELSNCLRAIEKEPTGGLVGSAQSSGG
jgi:tetratricopeptide (TPR) repeat protein